MMVWARLILFLCLMAPAAHAAGIIDRLKTAIGLNHSREAVCMAMIETSTEFAKWAGQGSTFALNSFAALQSRLQVEVTKPKLTHGYAALLNNEVVAGTLSTREVAERIEAALTVTGEEGSGGEEGNQLKLVAFSAPAAEIAKEVLQDLSKRLETAQENETTVAPVGVVGSIGYAVMHISLAAFAYSKTKSAPATVAALILVQWLLFQGWEGVKRITPGYHAADNFSKDLELFLNNDLGDRRSYFLISDSVEISEELAKQVSGYKSPLQPQWSPLMKQLDIVSGRFPTEFLFKLVGFGELNKKVWVHTDLLIEKSPDGELQAHMMVQFTQKKPNFPRKKKKVESTATAAVPEPGMVPVTIPMRK